MVYRRRANWAQRRGRGQKWQRSEMKRVNYDGCGTCGLVVGATLLRERRSSSESESDSCFRFLGFFSFLLFFSFPMAQENGRRKGREGAPEGKKVCGVAGVETERTTFNFITGTGTCDGRDDHSVVCVERCVGRWVRAERRRRWQQRRHCNRGGEDP